MAQNTLTPALEDYLETIYLLIQEKKVARVREIAKERQVKASSVSLALKRLSEFGLIRYEQRELIDLTDEGRIAARRVYARHVVLFQFFHDILGMDEGPAREEACGLEHALSNEGMDRFVRFFETISMCPTHDFHRLITQYQEHPEELPEACAKCAEKGCSKTVRRSRSLSQTSDGQSVKVLKVTATGDTRQKIIETGILPNVVITRQFAANDQIHITIDGNPISLTVREADSILVAT